MKADLREERIVVAVVILLAILMTTLVAIRPAGAVELSGHRPGGSFAQTAGERIVFRHLAHPTGPASFQVRIR